MRPFDLERFGGPVLLIALAYPKIFIIASAYPKIFLAGARLIALAYRLDKIKDPRLPTGLCAVYEGGRCFETFANSLLGC